MVTVVARVLSADTKPLIFGEDRFEFIAGFLLIHRAFRIHCADEVHRAEKFSASLVHARI